MIQVMFFGIFLLYARCSIHFDDIQSQKKQKAKKKIKNFKRNREKAIRKEKEAKMYSRLCLIKPVKGKIDLRFLLRYSYGYLEYAIEFTV